MKSVARILFQDVLHLTLCLLMTLLYLFSANKEREYRLGKEGKIYENERIQKIGLVYDRGGA